MCCSARGAGRRQGELLVAPTSISGDGRYAAFTSEATNLDPDDPATGSPEEAATPMPICARDIAPEVRITSAPDMRTSERLPTFMYEVAGGTDDLDLRDL